MLLIISWDNNIQEHNESLADNLSALVKQFAENDRIKLCYIIDTYLASCVRVSTYDHQPKLMQRHGYHYNSLLRLLCTSLPVGLM